MITVYNEVGYVRSSPFYHTNRNLVLTVRSGLDSLNISIAHVVQSDSLV